MTGSDTRDLGELGDLWKDRLSTEVPHLYLVIFAPSACRRALPEPATGKHSLMLGNIPTVPL